VNLGGFVYEARRLTAQEQAWFDEARAEAGPHPAAGSQTSNPEATRLIREALTAEVARSQPGSVLSVDFTGEFGHLLEEA
jgi:hypothetical protein